MIVIFIIFIIGLCVGSFLNVAIDRPMQKRSIIFGRSSCDFCHHELSWKDLIPVISFVLLKGRCRYCHKKLSLQYPVVELVTAISFIILYVLFSTNYLLFFLSLGLAASALVLFVADLKFQLLPNGSMISFGIFAFLIVLLQPPYSILFKLFVGICSSLPFLGIYIFSKGKAMGFGDVKLAFLMGFLLGFPNILVALYAAFLTGALVGIILILKRKVRFRGGTIAFGPFLLLGTSIALLWGNIIWNYFRIFVGF